MRRQRFAKIIATLGPASSDPQILQELFRAGVDIFRLNFSHGSHADHLKNIENLRRLESKTGRPIAILQDLQGPKFRVGTFAESKVMLTEGQTFSFDNDDKAGDKQRVFLPHPEIFAAVKVGDRLLVDDARACFEVTANNGKTIETRHIYGTAISDNKGVNMPDTILDVPVLTEKDKSDLQFGLAHGVDYVALSFVQRASDMHYLRQQVGGQAAILAKIEKPSAVDDIEGILEAGDAVMVARGDLGVELPSEKVPGVQKNIINKAREVGKPVIVATQMLESMIENPVATRAEATDVSNAIGEGADAVMLSGETAAGKYPLKAVNFMNRVIVETEKEQYYRKDMRRHYSGKATSTEDAISQGIKAVVNAMPIAAIACFTTSGGTAIRLSQERALTPLLAITPTIELARRLQLHWGIDADTMGDIKKFKTVVVAAVDIIKRRGYVEEGDWVAITVGVPFGHAGSTNTLRLVQIGNEFLRHETA